MTSLASPGSALDDAQASLLERDTERATTERVLAAGRAGRGGVIVVEGAAGIGKSRLLEAGIAHARELGYVVAIAQGDALELEFDYGVALQLFEPVVLERPAAFDGQAALASPLLEAGAGTARTLPGEGDAFSIVHGLFWLVANLAEVDPVLLVVDDAQWADAASLRALRYLGRRIGELPVVVMVAVRSGEPGAGGGELEAMRSDPDATVLYPAELGAGAISLLVDRAFPDGPVADRSFVAACRRATGGNPFLVHELLRQLRFEAMLPTADSAPLVEGLHGDTVRRSVLLRISRMGPDAATVASIAAVLGRDGTRARVQALAQLEPAVVDRVVAALVDADILREEDQRLEYAHPLIRGAVYGDLTVPQRAQLHAQAAQLLTADGAVPAIVAAHLLHAPPDGSPQAVDMLVAAAEQANERRSPASAARYLRRALAESTTGERRSQLLLELGRAAFAAGEPSMAQDAEAAVAAAVDDAERARALDLLGNVLHAAGQHEAAAGAYEQALEAIGPDGPLKDRHDLQARWILAASLVRSLAPVASRRAAELIAGSAEHDTAADRTLFATLCAQESRTGRSRERLLVLARRALAGGALIEDHGAGSSIPYLAINALNWAEDWQGCEAAVERAFEAARVRGSVQGFAAASQARGLLAWRVGRVEDVAADAAVALAARDDGWHAYEPLNAWLLVRALLERDEVDEAARSIEGLDDEHWARSVLYPYVLSARAFVRRAQGETEAALELQLAAGRVASRYADNPAIFAWRSDASWLATAMGRREQASVLAQEELERACRFGGARGIGVARVALGAALEGRAGRDELERAISELRASGAQLVLAEALLTLGSRQRRERDRKAAQGPLREALALAHACGSARLEALAREELAAAGVRPRRAAMSGAGALTPSEVRICRMAADGRTNRQIAEALFVTPKAVEFHLSNAYRKLGIASRGALGNALGVSR